MDEIRIRTKFEAWNDQVGFQISCKTSGQLGYAKRIEFEERKEGEYIGETFRISTHETQALFDELWRLGFKPKDGTGSAGQLLATEAHLGDMKTVAFKLLDHEIQRQQTHAHYLGKMDKV